MITDNITSLLGLCFIWWKVLIKSLTLTAPETQELS